MAFSNVFNILDGENLKMIEEFLKYQEKIKIKKQKHYAKTSVYCCEKYQNDPDYRKKSNESSLKYKTDKYANDPVYREKQRLYYVAYNERKTREKNEALKRVV